MGIYLVREGDKAEQGGRWYSFQCGKQSTLDQLQKVYAAAQVDKSNVNGLPMTF